MTFNDDPDLLKKVITVGETKVQSSQWNLEEPRPKKASQVRSNVNVLFTALWCIMNSCHKIVWPIRNSMLKRQKRTELLKNHSWILHHANAPAHAFMQVREFLTKNKSVIMPQPSYSPDLARADFFLFPKLKIPMKGQRFAMIEDKKENRNRSYWRYRKARFSFQDWNKCWHKCFISEEGLL